MSFAAVLERLSRLENPYPGLRPFDTAEAHLFFGRDQQVLDLLDRLTRNRFVAVLGLSGSGKSSLVRAGLIPALHEGGLPEPGMRWRVAIARPAGTPFASLTESLGCEKKELFANSHGLIDFARGHLAPGEALFVLIDQFEELFRYKDRAASSTIDMKDRETAASEAAAFIDLLLAGARGPLPIYVAVTMRTDYLGDCAEFPEFPQALNESQYLVPRLTREQRRQAIEGPLGRVGISSALVERILNDAGDEPDQLPILQHALMRTWSRWYASPSRDERMITTDDYEDAGEFRGALNQHADELLGSPAVLAAPKVVEIIFKRLSALGSGKRERRDPAVLSELWELCGASSEEQCLRVNNVVDVFRHGEATFLTPREGKLTAETYIDIAHESLIRNWKVLDEKWLPDEEKQAKTLGELLERARGWKAGKKELLDGLDLNAALEWDGQRNRSRKWAEHYVGPGAIEDIDSFILESRRSFEESELRERERRQAEIVKEQQLREAAEFRANAERSSALKTRRLSYVLIGLLLAAVCLALLAWSQTAQANRTRQAAENAVKASALVPLGKLDTAFDLALRGFSLESATYTRDALARTFPQRLLTLQGFASLGYSPVLDAEYSPDGRLIVTASSDNLARIWDAATGKLIGPLAGHKGEIHHAVFSQDGQRIATASYDHSAGVWNVSTGKRIATLVHGADVNSAVFSRDGRLVVTASVDKTARVWEAATGRPLATLKHGDNVNYAEFSSDGLRVVTASDDHTARVWDATSGKKIAEVGHAGPVNSAVFSPDGTMVLTASGDDTARVWNASTGQAITVPLSHSAPVNTAAFSPDGKLVVTASDDHWATVWRVARGGRSVPLYGHAAEVLDARFSADGQRVVTASRDHTARVWNALTGDTIAALEGDSDVIGSATFSPDGQQVLTASYDKTALVWNIAGAARLIAALQGHTADLRSVAFSADGQLLVSASADKNARVWEAAAGIPIAVFPHDGIVNSAVFSRDGKRVATASDDKTARLWDVIAKKQIVVLNHADSVNTAAFSPDGRRVLTASTDKTARIWDAATGKQLAELDHGGKVNSGVFSPDGKRVVTASDDSSARVWDAASGSLVATLSHRDRVLGAVFSPDGQLVATASADKTAGVWDAASGKKIAELKHNGSVNSAAFSPDGKRVVTASDDETARVWDAVSGQGIAILAGHSERVWSAEFSPDGKYIVTGSLDSTARVWNAATGQLIAKIGGHLQSVVSARFSPDGTSVATASVDDTARITSTVSLGDIVRLLSQR